MTVSGDADRYNHRDRQRRFSQPRDLFRPVDAAPEAAAVLQHRGCDGRRSGVHRRRQLAHFTRADPAYGAGVAERLGLTTRLQAAE